MIRRLLLLGLVAFTCIWFGRLLMDNPGVATITWGTHRLQTKTATLILLFLAACLLFYLLLYVLWQVLGLHKRLYRMHDARLHQKAARNLNQGLIQLTEGHWDRAEKLLTEYADRSKTPLLNYLGAARAAHMREAPERRDELLKKAIESDSRAQVAVGVSQAEMQLASEQLEQAYATLSNLRGIAPKNSYVLKLFAKVLYRQKNWEALLDLLPDLQKQNLLNSDNMLAVKAATLRGLFNKYAEQHQADKLQALWKKLPSAIRSQDEATSLFAKALHKANADTQCAQFIQNTLTKSWNDELADLYGRIEHANLNTAIQQAEKWLAQQPDNPTPLLLLARLHQQQRLWGVAKSYYEASLNQSPNTAGYLELAELLETIGEKENAELVYRTGLRYSIRQQGERLTLAASQRPRKKVADASYTSAPTL